MRGIKKRCLKNYLNDWNILKGMFIEFKILLVVENGMCISLGRYRDFELSLFED